MLSKTNMKKHICIKGVYIGKNMMINKNAIANKRQWFSQIATEAQNAGGRRNSKKPLAL